MFAEADVLWEKFVQYIHSNQTAVYAGGLWSTFNSFFFLNIGIYFV